MATPLRIAWNNLATATGVVMTSSADATGYPVTNLSNAMRWKKWKATITTGDQWVKFDLGSAQTFQVISLINIVKHVGGSVQVQANATDTWGAPTINDTITIPSPDYTRVVSDWRGATSSLRWIRIYFTNTTAVSSSVELGQVFIGPYLQPTVTLAPGFTVIRHDPSVQRRAIGGQRGAMSRAKFYEITGQLRPQSATARDDLRALFENVGSTIPIILAVDPSNESFTTYGTLQDLAIAHSVPSADLWDIPFHFIEDVA